MIDLPDDFEESADFVNFHVTLRLTSGSTINYQLFNTPPQPSPQHEHKHQIEIGPSCGSTTRLLPVPESPFATAAGTSRTSADPRQLRHASSICMPSLGHHLETKHPNLRSNDITTTRFLGFLEGSPPRLINNSPISFRLHSSPCRHSRTTEACFALLCFSLQVLFLLVWDLGAVSVVCISSVICQGVFLIYDIVFFLCRLLIQSRVKNALYKTVFKSEASWGTVWPAKALGKHLGKLDWTLLCTFFFHFLVGPDVSGVFLRCTIQRVNDNHR